MASDQSRIGIIAATNPIADIDLDRLVAIEVGNRVGMGRTHCDRDQQRDTCARQDGRPAHPVSPRCEFRDRSYFAEDYGRQDAMSIPA
jgi:hypothetical protein